MLPILGAASTPLPLLRHNLHIAVLVVFHAAFAIAFASRLSTAALALLSSCRLKLIRLIDAAGLFQ